MEVYLYEPMTVLNLSLALGSVAKVHRATEADPVGFYALILMAKNDPRVETVDSLASFD